MEREKWLNGWQRQGDNVQMGTGINCAGCGRVLGVVCVVIDENWNPPEKGPDWPFPESDCPICSKEYRDITVEDVVKLPLSILRQAIAIKKSAQQGAALDTERESVSNLESHSN